MERRIFGLETEYGVTCTSRGQRRLGPDEVARYLFRQVVAWGRSSNVFLENGARLYLDVGSHPEYATAECDSLVDLVSQDRAGERILASLGSTANERLAEEGVRGEVHLFKNNTDSASSSYGCHENYLMLRDADLRSLERVLVPHLISRQVFSGAGKILPTPTGHRFCIAQRAEHIWEGVSSATTRSRPIINTRDEPHADAELYRRLHVIVGDSNMCEFATFLKVATTAILLRMIESEFVLPDLTLEEPVRAIREISLDPELVATVGLKNGTRMSAVAIQRLLFERAKLYHQREGLPEQEARGLDMWSAVLDQLEVEPDGLIGKVDWVTKRALLEGHARRDSAPLGGPTSLMIDLQYHEITGQRGLYGVLERAGRVERITSDDAVGAAVLAPPSTTRANLRGRFVTAAKARQRDFTVDWVHLKVNDRTQKTVLCRDPFLAEDERVDELIRGL